MIMKMKLITLAPSEVNSEKVDEKLN